MILLLLKQRPWGNPQYCEWRAGVYIHLFSVFLVVCWLLTVTNSHSQVHWTHVLLIQLVLPSAWRSKTLLIASKRDFNDHLSILNRKKMRLNNDNLIDSNNCSSGSMLFTPVWSCVELHFLAVPIFILSLLIWNPLKGLPWDLFQHPKFFITM